MLLSKENICEKCGKVISGGSFIYRNSYYHKECALSEMSDEDREEFEAANAALSSLKKINEDAESGKISRTDAMRGRANAAFDLEEKNIKRSKDMNESQRKKMEEELAADREELEKSIKIVAELKEEKHACERCGSNKGISYINGHYLCSKHITADDAGFGSGGRSRDPEAEREILERRFCEECGAHKDVSCIGGHYLCSKHLGGPEIKRIGAAIGTENVGSRELREAPKTGEEDLKREEAAALLKQGRIATDSPPPKLSLAQRIAGGFGRKTTKFRETPLPRKPVPSSHVFPPRTSGGIAGGASGFRGPQLPAAPAQKAAKVVEVEAELVRTGRCPVCRKGKLRKVGEVRIKDQIVTDYECSNSDCPSN